MKNALVFFVMLTAVFTAQATTYDEDQLIDAIAYVESNHNEKAVSADGQCVGYLQIKGILIDECNRILGRKTYTRQDRLCKHKSREMFKIIQGKYNPNQDLVTAIRLWNEGPGHRRYPNRQTKYLKKVLKRYNSYRGQ